MSFEYVVFTNLVLIQLSCDVHNHQVATVVLEAASLKAETEPVPKI